MRTNANSVLSTSIMFALWTFAHVGSSILNLVYMCNYVRSDVAYAILKLCDRIKDRTKAEYGLEWLFGLPLYNLLTENSAPFEDITVKKTLKLHERWTDAQKTLQLNKLRGRTFDSGVR